MKLWAVSITKERKRWRLFQVRRHNQHYFWIWTGSPKKEPAPSLPSEIQFQELSVQGKPGPDGEEGGAMRFHEDNASGSRELATKYSSCADFGWKVGCWWPRSFPETQMRKLMLSPHRIWGRSLVGSLWTRKLLSKVRSRVITESVIIKVSETLTSYLCPLWSLPWGCYAWVPSLAAGEADCFGTKEDRSFGLLMWNHSTHWPWELELTLAVHVVARQDLQVFRLYLLPFRKSSDSQSFEIASVLVHFRNIWKSTVRDEFYASSGLFSIQITHLLRIAMSIISPEHKKII